MKKLASLLASLTLSCFLSFAEKTNTQIKNNSITNPPFLFIENKGQVVDYEGKLRPDIKFTAKAQGVNLYFSRDGIYYQFNKSASNSKPAKNASEKLLSKKTVGTFESFRLDMKLEGANQNAKIRKEKESEYYENYYLAQCPQGITGVNGCYKLVYENIYPKIDWVIYSNGTNLEYDFVIHPGGNPKSIKITYKDAEKICIEKNGSAKISTSIGEVKEDTPVSYILENKKEVATKFELTENTIQFVLENYDHTKTLVIDPVLLWSTYYGGTSYDYGYSVSTDSSGNVFLSGETDSNNGIAATGGFQSSHIALSDGFIAKFDENGTRLWATYFGAGDNDYVMASNCDIAGNIIIAGYTTSQSGISAGGFQNSFGGGQFDGFFAKFSPTGTRLWSSYYGGSADDVIAGCTTDANDNIYITGTSASTNNLSQGQVFQTTNGGSDDCFLAKFSPTGTRNWGTYFGGGGDDRSFCCATDKAGDIYISGYAYGSTNLGVGGFQNTYNGSYDAILAKFNGISGQLKWSTYYGDIDSDIGLACATDNSNNVYLTGRTNSSFSIASSGFQNAFGGGISDGFLAKFDFLGARVWGTYLGNTGEDLIQSCKTDSYENVVVCGSTSSTSGLASNGFQNSYGGGTQDAFVVGFSNTGTRIFGSYLGGSGDELGNNCSIDKKNNIYLAGQTASTNFTIVGNAQQTSYGSGSYDAFLTKIENACAASDANIVYSGVAYACSLSTLQLQASTGSGVSFNYQWQLNGTNIPGATGVNYIASQGGAYNLIVNQNGVCQDTSATLLVDSVPPSIPLCICTVDSLSKYNLLIWEKPVSTIIDSFRVYREDITNVFGYIKSIGYNQLSMFVDSNLLYANPNVTSKLYKISTVDVCGVESPKSAFHHTIKLNDQQNGNFDWNFYEIQGQTTPVLQYILLRDSVNSGNWNAIAITSGNVNQISDPDYNLYPNSRYRVVTNLGSLSCTPTMRTLAGFNTSRSNIKNKAVGINENDNFNLKITLTPNPAGNYLHLNNKTQQKIKTIRITDNLGRIVFMMNENQLKNDMLTLDISQLAPAIYALVIESEKFLVTKKFVKK